MQQTIKYLEYRIEIEKKYDEEEKELQFSLSNAIPKNSSLEQLCYIFIGLWTKRKNS